MAKRNKKRKYGSAAGRTRAAAATAGPGGGGGTMFQALPNDMEFFNPEAGKYTLRLLPYVVSDKKHPDGPNAPVDDIWYKRPFKRFRQIGMDKKPYISPRSIGKSCPVTEYYVDAKADPSIPDKEANKAKAQDCVMYNVQVVDRKKGPGPVMFWWISWYNFEKQLKKELLDPDNEEFASFQDLEGGYDLRVRFQQESFDGNKYIAADSIQFVERDDIDEDVLDEVADLDNILVVKEYDELRNIFFEIDDDAPDSDESKPEKDEDEPDCLGNDGDGPNKRKKKCKGCDFQDECESKAEKDEPEDEPEEDEPEEDPECPKGMDFGDDFDSKKKCKKCKIRDDCEKASEADDSDDDKGGSDGKCPKGHKWAEDCDEDHCSDDCDDCKDWDECSDAQEELNKNK